MGGLIEIAAKIQLTLIYALMNDIMTTQNYIDIFFSGQDHSMCVLIVELVMGTEEQTYIDIQSYM